MEQSLYFDGQPLQASDLQNTETTKVRQIRNRRDTSGFCTSHGVTRGLVLGSGEFEVQVTPGSAIDANGDYLEIEDEQSLTITTDDTSRYVLVRCVTTDGSNVGHPVTGVFSATRRTLSYQLYLADAVDPTNAITLGKINSVDSDGYPDFDLDDRDEWTVRVPDDSIAHTRLDPNGTIATHVDARGTGTVTAVNPHGLHVRDIGWTPDDTPRLHQLLDHTNGVEVPGSNVAKVLVNNGVNPGKAVPTVLPTGDSLLIGGARIFGSDLSTNQLSFADGNEYPGLYEVYYSKDGPTDINGDLELEKSFRMEYVGGIRRTVGVQLVDIASDHELGVFNLIYTVAKKTLRWAGGPPVSLVASSDRIYTLYSLNGKALRVWVDYSALPTAGGIDVIRVHGSVVNREKFLLTSLFWTGLSVGYLGYGNETTPTGYGNAPDNRVFGNLKYEDLSTSFKEYLEKFHAELHTDGWFSGGDGSALTELVFQVDAGVAWVNGKRLEIRTSEVTLRPNVMTTVYVTEDGDVATSIEDPSEIFQNSRERFARAWRVQTDAERIINTVDERIMFRTANDLLKLGNSFRYSSSAQQLARVMDTQGPFGDSNDVRRGRTRLMSSNGPSGYHPVNIYATHWRKAEYNPTTGQNENKYIAGIEIAINCVWTPDYGGTPNNDLWVATVSTEDSLVYGFDSQGFYIKLKREASYSGSPPTWTDTGAIATSWTVTPIQYISRDADLFMKTETGLNGALSYGKENPGGAGSSPFGIGFTNAVIPGSIVKAWALVQITSGQYAVLTGFNVQQAITDGTSTGFYIPLASIMEMENNLTGTGKFGTVPRAMAIISNSRGSHQQGLTAGPVMVGKIINNGGTPTVHVKTDGAVALSTIKSDLVYVVVCGYQYG